MLRLDRLRINDAQVREDLSLLKSIATVLDRLLFLLILLPLSLPGWFLNTPLIFLGKLFNSLTPYQESKATHTMVAMVLFAPVVYCFFGLFLWFFFGVHLSLCAILFPIVGLAHLRCLDEGKVTIKSIQAAFRLISIILTNSRRGEMKQLREKRADIQKRLLEIVNTYAKPEDKTLDNLKQDGEEQKGYTTKIVPKVVRRNSFSGEYL